MLRVLDCFIAGDISTNVVMEWLKNDDEQIVSSNSVIINYFHVICFAAKTGA